MTKISLISLPLPKPNYHFVMVKKPKKKAKKAKKVKAGHGGFRPNAGRKAIEQTVVMRIPKSKVAAVKELIGSNVPPEYRESY
jgi:hypothetical protein